MLPTKSLFFAGNTTLIYSHYNSSILINDVTKTKNKADVWFTTKTLTLNRIKSEKNILLPNKNLNNKSTISLLGITIDTALKWSHIHTISSQ